MQQLSYSPTTAYLPELVGCLSLGLLLIDATRYNLGRPSESARQFCFDLARTLPQILPDVRQQLVQDIEQALQRDAFSRKQPAVQHLADTVPHIVGYEADRQAWQQVVRQARALDTPAAADSASR